MSTRTRVAVLFGGRSGEHQVSCVTASGVLGAIDRHRHDVVAVGIDREGRWWLVDHDPAAWEQHGRVMPGVTAASALRTADGLPIRVTPSTGTDGCRLIPMTAGAATVGVDVVFPLLHGPFGEDGTVQGQLDLAGVPYVGSGVLSSAAGMDKPTMKTLLAAAGLPVADWVAFTIDEWRRDARDITARVDKLGRPVFVKPARAGSSVGVSRVDGVDDLGSAVLAAADHDPLVIVEEAVAGREVECGVLWDGPGADPVASPCGEIVLLDGRAFYDFEAKYLAADAVRLDCPADLDDSATRRVQQVALAAFAALRCEGLARVDTFVAGDRVVVNEVNTSPGFTPRSMYPLMWQAAGVDYPELVERLLGAALRRPAGLR